MTCQPFRRPYLLVPAISLARVLGELDVVRRVRINEIVGLDCNFGKIRIAETPSTENLAIGGEVAHIPDTGVAPERHVETPAAIEAAEPVISGSIQVIEKRRGLFCIRMARVDQLIETFAMRIVVARRVYHRDRRGQPALEPFVKVDQMRIDI